MTSHTRLLSGVSVSLRVTKVLFHRVTQGFTELLRGKGLTSMLMFWNSFA
jgi:hypothetical protein